VCSDDRWSKDRKQKEESMKIEDISVRVRHMNNHSSKLRARATVMLLVEGGFIELSGFSVFGSEDGTLEVAPPSQKWQDRYIDTVTLGGRIAGLVEEAVLAAYRRTLRTDNTTSSNRGSDVRTA
jgi:hypothetical protein